MRSHLVYVYEMIILNPYEQDLPGSHVLLGGKFCTTTSRIPIHLKSFQFIPRTPFTKFLEVGFPAR